MLANPVHSNLRVTSRLQTLPPPPSLSIPLSSLYCSSRFLAALPLHPCPLKVSFQRCRKGNRHPVNIEGRPASSLPWYSPAPASSRFLTPGSQCCLRGSVPAPSSGHRPDPLQSVRACLFQWEILNRPVDNYNPVLDSFCTALFSYSYIRNNLLIY